MSSHDPLAWLRDEVARREAAGLRRSLRPRGSTPVLVDAASNDYLGLARHPTVTEAAAEAARTWGAGSTGSRLVAGTTELHAELESALARFTGRPSTLVFSSGYLANLAAVTALSGQGSLVVSDAHNHASIVDACRLSRARVAITPHGDVAAVAKELSARDEERALVVTDAVFSVDGDLAPLRDLHAVSRQHGALLLVDEAHALGVVGGGRGALAAAGLAGERDVIATVTLSKALGSQGGAVLAAPEVTAHLVDVGRPFIFDTGLAPPSVAAALAALHLVTTTPELPERAGDNARRLAADARSTGLDASEPAAAVTRVLLGEPRDALDAAATCAEHGVAVGCFRPPSVPVGRSCLRITTRADLSTSELDRLATALRTVAARTSEGGEGTDRHRG